MPQLDQTPNEGNSAHDQLRAALYAGLRGQAEPVLVFPEATNSAASLWAASRLWVEFFREHNLRRGDRVALQWPASPGFIAFLAGAMWEGLSTAVIPPGMTPAQSMEFFDARLGLGCDGLTADNAGCPVVSEGWTARVARGPQTADVRLLMRTCGTSGCPGWVALSDENIWSVLDSHRPRLMKREDVVLSILPWFHSFGLIIDLLPALLGAGVIVREPSLGRDPTSILSTAAAYSVSWCSMVPLQTQRLASTTEGLDFLRGLRGGVVGGAPASRQLADAISATNLFVGYGQTEASPGIALGRPGHWVPGAIGEALGCETRIDDQSHLLVRGANVSYGKWTQSGLEVLDSSRWLDSGDLVVRRGDEMIFLGRSDNNFKLANGRVVDAAAIETQLRESDPRMADCAVISTDTLSLRVYVVMKDHLSLPAPGLVKQVLGSLADRLEGVTTLVDSPDMRTAKGSLDRLKLRRGAFAPTACPPLAA